MRDRMTLALRFVILFQCSILVAQGIMLNRAREQIQTALNKQFDAEDNAIQWRSRAIVAAANLHKANDDKDVCISMLMPQQRESFK